EFRRVLFRSVPGTGFGRPPADVADVAAAVEGGIGVEDLAPEPGCREAEPVVVADNGREVADADEEIGRTVAVANEGDHVALGVAALEPGEAGGVAVA